MSHSTAQQGVTQWRGYTLLLLTLVWQQVREQLGVDDLGPVALM